MAFNRLFACRRRRTLFTALAGLVLMALGKVEMKSKLPFGLFLSLGGLLALFAGPTIVARYLQSF